MRYRQSVIVNMRPPQNDYETVWQAILLLAVGWFQGLRLCNEISGRVFLAGRSSRTYRPALAARIYAVQMFGLKGVASKFISIRHLAYARVPSCPWEHFCFQRPRAYREIC